jgi:hypothetical protein
MGEYSGNHPRFSKRQEEHYDAKMAHDKDLSASARLHYLENDETHHPAKMSADLKDPVLNDDMNLENPVYAGGPEGHLGKVAGMEEPAKNHNQGYDDREDESIGARVGHKNSHQSWMSRRNESYGKWGSRHNKGIHK